MSLSHSARRLAAAVLGVILAAALLAVPGTPWEDLTTPAADAQTSSGWAQDQNRYNQCAFRRGTGVAEPYANQLCWIDMAGVKEVLNQPSMIRVGDPPPIPARVTKDLGRYVLSFDVSLLEWNYAEDGSGFDSRWATNNSRFFNDQARIGQSVFGGSVGGTDYFVPYSGDTTRPILRFAGSGTEDMTQMSKFQFRNITLRDKQTNQNVAGFRLNVIDAQMTQAFGLVTNEMMSVHTPDERSSIRPLRKFTPSGYVSACDPARRSANVFGAGRERYWDEGARGDREFICYETQPNAGNAGTYLLGGDGVNSLDVGLFTRGDHQAFALALNMGRMAGNVAPTDTTMERAATGQESKFDFTMALRAGSTDTPVPWQGAGQYTQVARQLDPNDVTGKSATDSMVFRSTASGDQANLALARYRPEWRCTVSGSTPQTFVITEGSVPQGFQLNNVSGGTNPAYSEVVYANPYSNPVQCNVTWLPRFKPASLTLRKSVTGTARDFTEVQNRRFTLNYACAAPAGYTTAYPNVPMTGGQTVAAGGSFTVNGLLAGAQCTISEQFPDGQPPARPGKQLTLTWTGAGVTQTADAVPTAQVTLREGANGVTGSNEVLATNNYDYRAGTLRISKQILGEAASDLGSPRDYRFELRCSGTDYAQTVTLRATGTGDELNGDVTFEGVPVERDCYLRPLSGLTATEGETIKFDGRAVTAFGSAVPAAADGTYLLRLPDYPQGGTPTAANVQIVARYSYLKRDVRVVKQLSGPAASLVSSDTTFPVTYRCRVSGDDSSVVEGSLAITTDSANPASIPGVRVGADCIVYESGTPAPANVQLDRTTITASNAADQVTTLSNDEAKTTPVLKVNSSTDPRQNRVVVTNHFTNRVGAVTLNKLVDSAGINESLLPPTYSLSFRCGTRTVETAPNTYRSVDLEGTVDIAAGGNKQLVATLDDASLQPLVNDRNGAMGVPYGNTCTFSEEAPRLGPGITWTSNAFERSVTVNGDNTTATVTNTFAPAGDGVTIAQVQSGLDWAFRDVSYNLSCTAANGTPISYWFTLNEGATSTVQYPASALLPGTRCTLTEVADGEDGMRDGFEIDRSSTISDGQSSASFPEEKEVSFDFTVGEKTVLNIAHVYDYADKAVDVSKTVQFDEETKDYISEVRKNVKYNRLFDVQLTCTPPKSEETISLAGKVSSPQSNDPATEGISFGNIPDGSDCVATEGETSAAEGIDFTQQVRVGDQTGDKSLRFTVSGDTPVELINTYSRRLASVDLTKIANAPIDIDAAFPDTPKDQVYYTHTFTMVCRDPEGTAEESGALPAIDAQTITGPGSASFVDVPVGADCEISGDKFGQLDLSRTIDGFTLETHLRPERVVWQLRRDDQEATEDRDLADGVTTSGTFRVKENTGNGGPGNAVDLTNYYEFVMSKVRMTKTIQASDEDMALVRRDNPTLNFNYQCVGAGYSLSGLDLPASLSAGDQKIFADPERRYVSQEVEVPSGALCLFSELEPSSTPAALQWEAVEPEIAKRVGAENEPPVTFDFVNKYTRRTVPVRLSALQEGFTGGLRPEDAYVYNVVCKDPAQTSVSQTFTVAESDSTFTVADPAAPINGKVVNLPVGYDCELTLSGSPMQARPQLEVTGGARTPYAEFGAWVNDTALESNPDRKIVTLAAKEVTPAMKQYTYTFAVPETLRSQVGEPVMTVAGEVMHLRDKVDLTFEKQSQGAAGEGKTFQFTSTCGEGFQLRAGESQTIKGVDVDRNCTIQEIVNPDSETGLAVYPIVSVGETGGGIGNATATNSRDTETGAATSAGWNFRVLTAPTASDLASGGPFWKMVGINSFPGVALSKKIDGTPLSAVTGAVASTALLADNAETMRVTYTVTNNGALPAQKIALMDPSLAGLAVRALDNREFAIDPKGNIPAEVCAAPETLAVGDKWQCSFDIVIPGDKTTSYSYRGEATVTATAGGTTVSASDTYGAYRLSAALGFLLPDTGMQTLVWMLVLGLIVVGVGLWLYMRQRDEEEDELA